MPLKTMLQSMSMVGNAQATLKIAPEPSNTDNTNTAAPKNRKTFRISKASRKLVLDFSQRNKDPSRESLENVLQQIQANSGDENYTLSQLQKSLYYLSRKGDAARTQQINSLRGLLPTEVELKVEKLLEAVKNPDEKIVASWAAALGVSASAIQAHITDRNIAQSKEYTFVDSSASSRGLGAKGSSPVTPETVCHSWNPQMPRSWPIVPIMANPLPTPPPPSNEEKMLATLLQTLVQAEHLQPPRYEFRSRKEFDHAFEPYERSMCVLLDITANRT